MVVLLFLNIFGYSNNSMETIIVLDLMFLIFFLPFVSIYLARVYHDVAARPKYIIDWENSIVSSQNKEGIKRNN